MPLLDTIKEMQQSGIGENEIVEILKSRGFSPLQINQGLEQSKIKSAISEPETQPEQSLFQQAPSFPETQSTIEEGEEERMRQGVMETAPQISETPEYIYPTQQAHPQEYTEYESYQAANTETMADIAEQIADEKIDEIKKEISALATSNTIAERKIKNIDERLKKIEEIIEKLQATIIGKVGSYGQTMQDIKKEMQLMQESFSKALPSFIEKAAGKEGKTAKTRRKSDGFESYLRR